MRLKNFYLTFEPIGEWPTEETLQPRRSNFDSPFHRTCDLLDRELLKLEADNVVVQLDLNRRQLRQDGGIRSGCRPYSDRVILCFDSKHGPQTVPCDTFDNWHDNIRAIALSLESLRQVERYGVARLGQQYRGWQALPAPASYGFSSRESAWAYIAGLLGLDREIPSEKEAAEALRDAARKTHPDQGGDDEEFKKVVRATERLL